MSTPANEFVPRAPHASTPLVLELQIDGLRVQTKTNQRGGNIFAIAARKTRAERERVRLHLNGVKAPALPVTVVLRRVAPNRLDASNAVEAMKAVQDEIADWLGLPNDRDPRVTWLYGQERRKEARFYAVRVQFYAGQERCRCGAPLAGGVFVDPAR